MNTLNHPALPHRQNRSRQFFRAVRKHRLHLAMILPVMCWYLLFRYGPLYGITLAFKDFQLLRGITGSPWVGLANYKRLFGSYDFKNVFTNTLVIAGLNFLFGFPAPILLALMLNELRAQKFKRVAQSLSYLPHFISWVVAGTMVTTVLGTDGVVNDVLLGLGVTKTRIQFLQKGEWYWWISTIVNIWKSLGWSAIIYLSAMAGVSEELCEAGSIDGMGRLGIAIHITLPAILPTIVLLWIMQVGNVLSAGFDQHLIIGNTITQRYWEVIDTYTYRYGVQNGYYSLGTAVSLMKSVIGFVLVLITNGIARKVGDVGLF